MTVFDALYTSFIGIIIVFAVLFILMLIIYAMSMFFKKNKLSEPEPSPDARPVPARGSCGEISLYGVGDRTAAMAMAIVADEMKAPLCELRFISIKEVEE